MPLSETIIHKTTSRLDRHLGKDNLNWDCQFPYYHFSLIDTYTSSDKVTLTCIGAYTPSADFVYSVLLYQSFSSVRVLMKWQMNVEMKRHNKRSENMCDNFLHFIRIQIGTVNDAWLYASIGFERIRWTITHNRRGHIFGCSVLSSQFYVHVSHYQSVCSQVITETVSSTHTI